MKKGILIIGVTALLVALYFLVFSDTMEEKKEPQDLKPAALAISKNPESFNTAFGSMLNQYYNLKNALVEWNEAEAAQEAEALAQKAQQVIYDSLQADETLVRTAQSFTKTIVAESKKLSNAPDIQSKRRAFSTISENMYSLLNTVRYDREVVYHAMCPMAFNDTEQAYWLSRDSAITNPYLGTKHPKYKSGMLHCGEITDEINFTER